MFVLDVPKEIALGKRTDILALPIDDGDSGITVMLHLFQHLAQGKIVIDIRYISFWCEQKNNIHLDPFPAVDTLDRLFVDFQHRHEYFLWDFYITNLLHPFFTLFLLLQQLALTADIAAIALGNNILTQR